MYSSYLQPHFFYLNGEELLILNTSESFRWHLLKKSSVLIYLIHILGFALRNCCLFCRLSQMWRIMHGCHQSQALISQQLSNLGDNHNTILNSEYHHQATIQFESEASYWYNSFCKLVKSQQEYVRTLSKWIQLTNCLRDGQESSNHSSIRTISEQWELGLDGLPDKVLLTLTTCHALFFK